MLPGAGSYIRKQCIDTLVSVANIRAEIRPPSQIPSDITLELASDIFSVCVAIGNLLDILTLSLRWERSEVVEKHKHTLTHTYCGDTTFGLPGSGSTVLDAESSHLCLRLRVISKPKQETLSSQFLSENLKMKSLAVILVCTDM